MALLTEKQKRFIDYFIETGNQTEAARLAGYKRPNVQGAQNYVKLRSQIDNRLDELESKRIAKGEEVLQYLTSVMRGELTEEVPMLCGDGYQELKNKDVGAKDRLKAAELLGKRYGLFSDKVELSGEVNTNSNKLDSILEQLEK